ncbi:MAG: glycosyltransferase family 1 protein [Dehalococcoidia bacterium]
MAGAGVYTYQLVRALANAPGTHRLAIFARPGLFDDLAEQHENVHVVHVEPASRGGRLAWEQAVLPLLLRRMRIDVLHSPHHHTPVAAIGVRRVVTFHDVTFLLLPERYPLARRLYMESVTRAAARIARAVITPSQTVREEVVRRLGVPQERVVTVYEAAAPQYTSASSDDIGRARWKYHLPNEYLLSVGSLEPGKNRPRLIRAYARLRERGLESPLVIVGQPAWQYEAEYELVARLGLSEHVKFLGYVPDEDLPALYSGATVFVFPSLYEGFGLPLLEAMACGAPVITSQGSATQEVAGDAALLIDPRDTDAIERAIDQLISNRWLRSDLRTRGLEQAKKFSWERAARDTLAVYQIVAAQR